MSDRDFDIVVYGATGFVGSRAVRYLAGKAQALNLRWAIAGRDRTKLEALAAQNGNPPLIVAEGTDGAALDALAARTRVVLAMAGPFALYADRLVAACAATGTHYADITGESPWVRTLIDRFHERAIASGAKIVPGCGFDSIPSDIGAYAVARYAQRELGTTCAHVDMLYTLMGGVNGGTIATFLGSAADPHTLQQLRDPQLLTPAESRVPAALAPADPLLARFEPEACAWVAPFVMGPINTRVVRRSAALYAAANDGYGDRFSYQEYLAFSGGPVGAAIATGVAAGSAFGQLALTLPLGRALIAPLVPKPGSGPSDASIANGWFRGRMYARTADGRPLRGTISGKGDPSNAITLLTACESALALAFDGDKLPGGAARGGLLTPASALGDAIVDRLRAAGMTISVTTAA